MKFVICVFSFDLCRCVCWSTGGDGNWGGERDGMTEGGAVLVDGNIK